MDEQSFKKHAAAERAAEARALATLQGLAIKWHRHAAERGLENSAYHLGIAHGYSECALALEDELRRLEGDKEERS